MAFLYSQIDGGFWEQQADNSWKRIAVCFAGHGAGLNNPKFQHVKMVGPVPCGNYKLVAAPDKQTGPHSLGPIVFFLQPSPFNDMQGRDGFFLHWDNRSRDYTASDGCIVNDGQHNVIGTDPPVNFFGYIRDRVAQGNAALEVVEQPPLPEPTA